MFRSARNVTVALAGLGLIASLAACSGGTSSSTPATAPQSATSSIKTAPQIHPDTVTVTPTKVLFRLGVKKAAHVFVSPSSDYPFGLQSNCAGIAKITAGLYNEFTVKPLAKNGKCTATFTDEIQNQSVNLPITNHSNA